MAIKLRPKEVQRFRLFFGEKREFYTVYIFKTRREMTDWCNTVRRAFGDDDLENDFGALTHPWTIFEADGAPTKDIGFIAFCEPYLWNYVIVHELGHATLEWFFRHRDVGELNHETGDGQEDFAWELGEATKQVFKRLKRAHKI